MRKIVWRLPLYSIMLLLLGLAWRYKQAIPERAAREVWREHEQVVSDAAEGKRVDLNDFADAALFFAKLTGINVPGDHSTIIDWMPNKDTGTALVPLRRWYAQHHHRLYWDEESKSVKVRLEAREAAAQDKAQAIWGAHLSVVDAAAKGKEIDPNAFREARHFFEELTGITVPEDASPLIDWSPDGETLTVAEPLRSWCDVNCDRLYWDEVSQTVRVRPW